MSQSYSQNFFELEKAYFSLTKFGMNDQYFIIIKGKNICQFNRYVFLDIFCENFNALPIEATSAIKLMLPYRLNYDQHNFGKQNKQFDDILNQFDKSEKTCIKLFSKNQLSLEKLCRNMQDVVNKGDPIITLEFFEEDKTFIQINTKASLLLASIKLSNKQNQPCILYKGQPPKIKRRSNIYIKIRMWLLALIFMVLCWIQLLRPEIVNGYFTPKIFNIDYTFEYSWNKVLPINPSDLGQAYDFGSIVKSLDLAIDAKNQTQVTYCLEELQNMTGRKNVTIAQAHLIRSTIQEALEQKGIISKCYGMLSFINFIWLMSIIGLAISVGPCLMVVFKPFIKFFKKFIENFIDLIYRFLVIVFRRIIIPLVLFLHEWGVIELVCYIISLQIVLEGVRLNNENSMGTMITLTGLILVVFSFGYSTILHTQKMRTKRKPQLLITLIYIWLACCLVPITILLQSVLLGYLSFAIIFTLLGFRFICIGLGFCLGWDNDNTMIRSYNTSQVIIITFCILKYFGFQQLYLAPFSSAIQVLGANIYFLASLIMCSRYFSHVERGLSGFQASIRYAQRNLLMIIQLIVIIYFGNVYGCQAIKNTAIVYAVLYSFEKFNEIYFEITNQIWVWIFLVSLIFYRIAIWIHLNPAFIASLFTYDKI